MLAWIADMGIKKFILLGINSAILAGSCLMKIPQIINILKASSVMGLSEAWVINEFIAGIFWVYYNFLVGHAFLSWGEALMVSIQNLVIVVLFWWYSPQLGRTPRLIGAVVFVIGSAVVLTQGLPSHLLAALGTSPIFLGNGAKIPQIWKNYQQGHTGTLAIVPAVLGAAGNFARVFTSILQTPDDIVAIANPVMASTLWVVMLSQFILYRKETAKVQEEARKKKDENAKKEK
eukprot:TRINITY_DN15077_c2_g1_i1.p1 TRINITY_DN15077_c2_g1~~TRINITY_DN15077_c2_g1_i1.p1  ORF type:complete len:233 (+),score=39.81 TRINITY_DN15077_c2_g1_i1:120-818(+)